ncbi:MAG: hypothetical protein COU46_00640 [Candidatus Niyogibacteria bacterium CG10_big_fil_rev_8_21_14_0_10_42_19]|uniref:DDH domain-containing protein n=1 Tax=Candidatus Niyogibacteria bacterium CG10_big_fil_rev_8_21_14_0_10_42_19 TaxID=1974725 RepID=A0A2H0TGB4_9BACT|nr:MAG: hypothetical protein COU46_00640 [Candidatus Niyogibacteria bacterium CG10_big_fil_rev_8_21_14_0_10_42_19]
MDRYDKLTALFKETKKSGKKVAIFSHSNPDPDSIASAAAIRLLARHFGLEADIFFRGKILHPQNKVLVSVLNLGFKPRQMSKFKRDDYDIIIFTDVAILKNQNGGYIDLEPDIIFDHHDDRPSKKIKFHDVRKIGSVSTILTEYLKNFSILKKGDKTHSRVATALFWGIKIDTNDLVSEDTTPKDHEALKYLNNFVDTKASEAINNYPKPDYFYKCEKMAEAHRIIKGGCVVVGLGHLTLEQSPAISYIADRELLRKGIAISFVIAVVGDKILQVSFRSRDINLLYGTRLVSSVFNLKNFGVRRGVGGGKIPLKFFYKNYKEGKKINWDKLFSEVSGKILRARRTLRVLRT